MKSFILKRFLSVLASLWVVVTLVFFLMRAVPGGPFDQERKVPPGVEEALKRYYDLSAPAYIQYKNWMVRLVVHQDLGPSFRYAGKSVNEIIRISFPHSASLGLMAALLALTIGVPAGIFAATRHNKAADHVTMALSMIGVSVPRFVLAPILIFVFSLTLYIFPAARWETWRHMVLPVICAGLPMAAYIARLSRAGMLEVLRSDFIRTARAKGLSERRVIMKHALRGALLPVVTYLAPGLSGLLVGSLVVERIFNIPGMGRYLVEGAANRDYNVVLGVVVVYGSLVMVFNGVVDVLHTWLDPRITLEKS